MYLNERAQRSFNGMKSIYQESGNKFSSIKYINNEVNDFPYDGVTIVHTTVTIFDNDFGE